MLTKKPLNISHDLLVEIIELHRMVTMNPTWPCAVNYLIFFFLGKQFLRVYSLIHEREEMHNSTIFKKMMTFDPVAASPNAIRLFVSSPCSHHTSCNWVLAMQVWATMSYHTIFYYVMFCHIQILCHVMLCYGLYISLSCQFQLGLTIALSYICKNGFTLLY